VQGDSPQIHHLRKLLKIRTNIRVENSQKLIKENLIQSSRLCLQMNETPLYWRLAHIRSGKENKNKFTLSFKS